MRRDRTVRDAVYGVAVGDALGVPVEFRERDSYCIEAMTGGGSHERPTGTFSDDTSLTLATCNSIRICRDIDVDDMRMRYRAWLFDGAYAADGDVFDVGRTTAVALECGRGQAGGRDNGNGSLMRIVPLAFAPGVTDWQIEDVSAITHAHEVSKRACVIYVHLARRLLAGDSVAGAIDAVVGSRESAAPFERLVHVAGLTRDEVRSTGYVVDTLEAALWCLATTSRFEDAVLTAVNLGGDTDTVGAVTGGLAGIAYGYDAIPREWIGSLRGRGILEACLF